MSQKEIKVIQTKDTIQSFVGDVRNYLDFVNKIAELIRISDGIGTEPMDKDITVGDLMLALIRKGEQLQLSADTLHELASSLKVDENV